LNRAGSPTSQIPDECTSCYQVERPSGYPQKVQFSLVDRSMLRAEGLFSMNPFSRRRSVWGQSGRAVPGTRTRGDADAIAHPKSPPATRTASLSCGANTFGHCIKWPKVVCSWTRHFRGDFCIRLILGSRDLPAIRAHGRHWGGWWKMHERRHRPYLPNGERHPPWVAAQRLPEASGAPGQAERADCKRWDAGLALRICEPPRPSRRRWLPSEGAAAIPGR
jgi:hypothetical protein